MMIDLIDGYKSKGLISDLAWDFVRCERCGIACHINDLTDVDSLTYGGHIATFKVCADCFTEEKEEDNQ